MIITGIYFMNLYNIYNILFFSTTYSLNLIVSKASVSKFLTRVEKKKTLNYQFISCKSNREASLHY